MQDKILCRDEFEMVQKIKDYVEKYLRHNNRVEQNKIERLLRDRNQSQWDNKIDKDCKFSMYAEEKTDSKGNLYVQATVCSLIGCEGGSIKHYQCFKSFIHTR